MSHDHINFGLFPILYSNYGPFSYFHFWPVGKFVRLKDMDFFIFADMFRDLSKELFM